MESKFNRHLENRLDYCLGVNDYPEEPTVDSMLILLAEMIQELHGVVNELAERIQNLEVQSQGRSNHA